MPLASYFFKRKRNLSRGKLILELDQMKFNLIEEAVARFLQVFLKNLFTRIGRKMAPIFLIRFSFDYSHLSYFRRNKIFLCAKRAVESFGLKVRTFRNGKKKDS